MSTSIGSRFDPPLFRDVLRLFRAARAVRNALKSLTERQRADVMSKGLGIPLSSLIAAVAMLEGYSRKPVRGEHTS